MNWLPNPIRTAALTAAVVLPFSLPAAGTLLFTSMLGAIINADYGRAHRRVRLPRKPVQTRSSWTRPPFCCETNRLAA